MHHFRTVSILVILLHLFAIGFISNYSQAAQPSATITLDQSDQEANVGPGEDGIVRFTGQVEVQMVGPGSNVQMIVVTLEADCVWSTSISPTTMSFSAQDSSPRKFEVVVKVPNFTSATLTEEMTVWGTVKTIPGFMMYRIAPANGIITIKPYTMISLSSGEPYQQGERGESLGYDLRIKNDGNCPTQVDINISDYEGLQDKGWQINTHSEEITIEEGANETVSIRFEIPPYAPLDTYEAGVKATAHAGNNLTDHGTYDLFIEVVKEKKTEEVEDDDDNGQNPVDAQEPDESLTITHIRVEPRKPYQSTDVKIFAVIRTHHKINTARVNYWFSNSTSSTVQMKRSGNEYYANLGRFKDGVTLYYNITAMDAGANIVSSLARSVKVGVAYQEEKVIEEKSVPGADISLVLSSIIITFIILGLKRR